MTTLPTVTAVIDEAVGSGRIPGALVAVNAGGTAVHRGAAGVLDEETRFPLGSETVLWLASLSKVIGTVALMTLVDDGSLGLDDPLSRYVPAFGEPGRVRALRPGSPSPLAPPFGPPPDPRPEYDIVPAERGLTVLDLLTHTGGLQSIFRWNPEYVPPRPAETLAEHVPGLGGLVRDFQAGQDWAYSNGASFDVLSRIIEIVAGEDLAAFLGRRVFDPLGMRRTGFGRAGGPGTMPLPAPFLDNPVVAGDTFRTTSAGLWGDAEDYLALADMLLARGNHDGSQVLTEKSVARMTTNQVGDLCPGLNGRDPAPGVGFGLSLAVLDDPEAADEALPAGTFGWDGVGTRRFWACPSGGWSLFAYAPDVSVQRDIEAAVSSALT